ncbi:MAG: M48 family metallopeptidase [Candidatus Nomurabacteria bacterium]|nr:M48 family metallopeptidase [Candidatus Nomurabacteria bacterium]
MATLYTHQDSNIRKTWLMMIVFLVVVGVLGYFLYWYFGNPIILVIAGAFAILQVAGSYWFSDKIVLSMSGAKRASREAHFELYNITENLAITAGLPNPKLYIIDEQVPNAFATGRDPEHAVIAVTTGLLTTLNRTELEGVIAHEMSHIGNRDILIMTVAVMLVGFVMIVSDIAIRSAIFGGGRRNSRSDGKAGSAIAIIGFALLILSPIFAMVMNMSISRKREYLADASGALLTRYPDGLANALEKISAHGGKMKRANKSTAHLFISNPFGGSVKSIFATHPPVEERIKRLRMFQ